MIQRIQSLWLFLATCTLIAVLFLPIGNFIFTMPHGRYECTAFNMTQALDVLPLHLPVWLIPLFSIVAGLLSFFAIFLFKKRDRQIRWVWAAFIFEVILAVGLTSMFLYFKFALDAWVGFGPAVLMPFLALLLDYLAIKGIKKDDALVKSLDRIR